jgi:Ca2+-binding RTX toxin-like protein
MTRPVLPLPFAPVASGVAITISQGYGGPNGIDDPKSTLSDSHNGYLFYSVDFGFGNAPATEALSVGNGMVVDAWNQSVAYSAALDPSHIGKYVTVWYPDVQLYVSYFHLKRVDVVVGQQILLGDGVGIIGSTGVGTGTHLHLQIGSDTVTFKSGIVADGSIATNGTTPPATFSIANGAGNGVLTEGMSIFSDNFGADGVYLQGGSTDDALGGGPGADYLVGGAGNDVLIGGGGQNAFDGGAGNDTINFSGGNGYLIYSSATSGLIIDLKSLTVKDGLGGTDTLLNVGYLTFDLTRFADVLRGGEFNDYMRAGPGNDTFNGRGGIDTWNGSSAPAAVEVNLSDAGNFSNGASDGFGTVDVIVFVENIVGSNFDDTLTGSGGSNDIDGGAGNDKLAGLGGSDLLTGGAGADTFLFANPTDVNGDRISDFSRTDLDKIDLRAIDANSLLPLNQKFSFLVADGQAFGGHRGELRWAHISASEILVQGDINGDKSADFSLTVVFSGGLVATDFFL